jgi:spore maturation protein CgeB
MRIGVIGLMGPDLFASNIVDALRRMGHYVLPLGPAYVHYQWQLASRTAFVARQAMPRLDERIQRRIVRSALDGDCDLVINVDAHLMPEAVRRLRLCGVRIAFWFPDHVANLGRELMLLGPYDALFFKEPHLVECLKGTLGLPAFYLPEACNPRWHRPLVSAGTEPHFVMAGTMRPSRVRLIERLMAKGIPLKVYGGSVPRWLGQSPMRAVHMGYPIWCEEKAQVFRSAVGVINTLYPAEVIGVNARLFEATGCGAAVITEFRPSVPDLFDIGSEVLEYHDFKGLVDQADRLLSEAGLTSRLGDAAAVRAHRDHTYDVRLSVILEKLL